MKERGLGGLAVELEAATTPELTDGWRMHILARGARAGGGRAMAEVRPGRIAGSPRRIPYPISTSFRPGAGPEARSWSARHRAACVFPAAWRRRSTIRALWRPRRLAGHGNLSPSRLETKSRSTALSSSELKWLRNGVNAASIVGSNDRRSSGMVRQGDGGCIDNAACQPSGIDVLEQCGRFFLTSRGSRWVCGPSGLLPSRGGIGW